MAAIVPGLLLCVAVYSVSDSINVTFSFALRGAGDTRFVSLLTFAAGLADHGRADLRRRQRRRQHLLGLGFRDGVHRRHVGLLLLSIPVRAMEEHARDRGGSAVHGG